MTSTSILPQSSCSLIWPLELRVVQMTLERSRISFWVVRHLFYDFYAKSISSRFLSLPKYRSKVSWTFWSNRLGWFLLNCRNRAIFWRLSSSRETNSMISNTSSSPSSSVSLRSSSSQISPTIYKNFCNISGSLNSLIAFWSPNSLIVLVISSFSSAYSKRLTDMNLLTIWSSVCFLILSLAV